MAAGQIRGAVALQAGTFAGSFQKGPRAIRNSMTRELDQVFAALSDPTRREILTMLLEDDMAVTDVAHPFEMSLAAISKHLGVLTAAGLISQEKRGRVKWCKLEPDALRAASVWMQGFGQFEPVHLEAFERFLAQELPEAAGDPSS
jgi:DNA-binding transcriptional ArsR family regulator